jgi:hypothetical protein
MQRPPSRVRRLTLAIGVAMLGFAVTSGSAAAVSMVEVPAEWDVAGIAKDGRSIDLFFNAGGCRRGPVRASVVETPTTVTLTLLQGSLVYDDRPHPIPCPADHRRGLTSVRLAAPLAGRAIKGRPAVPVPLGTVVADGNPLRWRVPRVVGMSPWEARRALTRRGFAVRLEDASSRAPLPQIVGQSPGPWSALAQGAVVDLRVARRQR